MLSVVKELTGRPPMRVVLIAALIAAVACDSGPLEPANEARPGDTAIHIAGTRWRLVELDGRGVSSGTAITLDFADTTASGYGGCNWFGGPYEADGASLRFSSIASTLRMCVATVDAGLESRYLEALGTVRGYTATGESLQLRNVNGAVVMRFAPR
jgi:heat shock protein HslJ